VESYNNFSKITSLPRNTLKYLLPESFRTSLVWTINARSLLNFLKLRLTPNAHYEIRHLALLILELVKANYGDLFKEVWLIYCLCCDKVFKPEWITEENVCPVCGSLDSMCFVPSSLFLFFGVEMPSGIPIIFEV